jgi:hypothetical protein
MPLFTYIVSYKGASHVVQERRSNYRGWWSSWTSEIPAGALPGLTPSLKQELSKPWGAVDWVAVLNRTHVWKKSFPLGGSEFSVYVIQTEA